MSGAIGNLSSVVNGVVLRDLHRESRRVFAGYKQQLAICSISAASAISSLISIFLRNASLLYLGYSATFRGTFIIPCICMFFFHRLIKRIETTNNLEQRLVKLEKELPTGGELSTGTLGERVEQNDRAREVGEREFPRLGEIEDDNRSLSQRIDDACAQTALSRMQKVVYDIALVVYLHIPEIVLLSHLALSFVLLCSGICVVGHLVQILLLLWTVGEQGLFFGFHPRENAGPFYAPLNRVIEIFSPIHFIFSKCLFWMKLIFLFRYGMSIGQIIALLTGSYVVVNYFFPKFFDFPKFFRVILEEDMPPQDGEEPLQKRLSDMFFPSPDHFTPLVRTDLYEGKNCKEMLKELKNKLPGFLISLSIEDGESLSLVRFLFLDDDSRNILSLGLHEKDIKLMVGSILKDQKKLRSLLSRKDDMLNVCSYRLGQELNLLIAEWYEEMVSGETAQKYSELQYQIRQQFLIVLQQSRDVLARQTQQEPVQNVLEVLTKFQQDKLLAFVRVVLSPLLDYVTTNYYSYIGNQIIYGTILGLSETRFFEDQMAKMNYETFCLLKWFGKLFMVIVWLCGSYDMMSLNFMPRYFRGYRRTLFKAICEQGDQRISKAKVWELLHSEKCLYESGEYEDVEEADTSEEQLLEGYMPLLLHKTGILKTGLELEKLGYGKAPLFIVPLIPEDDNFGSQHQR